MNAVSIQEKTWLSQSPITILASEIQRNCHCWKIYCMERDKIQCFCIKTEGRGGFHKKTTWHIPGKSAGVSDSDSLCEGA